MSYTLWVFLLLLPSFCFSRNFLLYVLPFIGSIYNIRSDMAKNPYNSISVVWVDRDAETSTWVYKYDQLDNECSPWDLKLSKFVLPEKVGIHSQRLLKT